MKEPDSVSENIVKGQHYRFKIFEADDFSNLENITQVWGLIFNEQNQLLIVSATGNTWFLPGGTVEEEESLLQTLDREMYEEAAVILDPESIKPFFYQTVFRVDGDKEEFESTQVRYTGRVKSQEEFQGDPGGNADGVQIQKFIDVRDLKQYIDWGETTDWIIEKLLNFIAQ